MTKFIPIKEYLCSLIVGKTLHFKCNCPIAFDERGIVKSFQQAGHDIILYVERVPDKKMFTITLNSPGLVISE